MKDLILTPNKTDPDTVYDALTKLLSAREDAENLKRAAKLIFLLANHIGKDAIVLEAMSYAASEQL